MACFGRPPIFAANYYDVKPLKISDFDTEDTQAHYFIHGSKVCSIIGNIADLDIRRKEVVPDEILELVLSLCRWIEELPTELRLYDAHGNRKEFCLMTSQIFILYFAAIIMLQLLQGASRQRATSLRSLIAASCISRLYEEINFRELTESLMPINGFFCMLASLPQIYYRPQCEEEEHVRQEEIEILCSILGKMRYKYGGSEMVLCKIRGLQAQIRASGEENATGCNQGSEYDMGDTENAYSKRLFPFPMDMSSHMKLVYSEALSRAGSFFPMDSEWASWLVTEGHGFVDFLEMLPGVEDTV